jgi:hypothetical protein
VVGAGRAQGQPADRDLLSRGHLDDVLEATFAQERRQAARHDHRQLPPQALERREVEVVVVGVRQEDRVQVVQRLDVDARRPPQVRDAPAQQRVGEQPNPVELEEHGGVADVAQPGRHGAIVRPHVLGPVEGARSVLYARLVTGVTSRP